METSTSTPDGRSLYDEMPSAKVTASAEGGMEGNRLVGDGPAESRDFTGEMVSGSGVYARLPMAEVSMMRASGEYAPLGRSLDHSDGSEESTEHGSGEHAPFVQSLRLGNSEASMEHGSGVYAPLVRDKAGTDTRVLDEEDDANPPPAPTSVVSSLSGILAHTKHKVFRTDPPAGTGGGGTAIEGCTSLPILHSVVGPECTTANEASPAIHDPTVSAIARSVDIKTISQIRAVAGGGATSSQPYTSLPDILGVSEGEVHTWAGHARKDSGDAGAEVEPGEIPDGIYPTGFQASAAVLGMRRGSAALFDDIRAFVEASRNESTKPNLKQRTAVESIIDAATPPKSDETPSPAPLKKQFQPSGMVTGTSDEFQGIRAHLELAKKEQTASGHEKSQPLDTTPPVSECSTETSRELRPPFTVSPPVKVRPREIRRSKLTKAASHGSGMCAVSNPVKIKKTEQSQEDASSVTASSDSPSRTREDLEEDASILSSSADSPPRPKTGKLRRRPRKNMLRAMSTRFSLVPSKEHKQKVEIGSPSEFRQGPDPFLDDDST